MRTQRTYKTTHDLVMTGLFVALGIIIPYITSHAWGVPGTVLLPMHIPVLLAGFFCGSRYGALAGLVTPLLSSLITGMPPPFPMLPIMMGELTMYGFTGGLMYRKFRLPMFAALPAAMVAGRAVFGLMLPILLLAAPGNMMLMNMSVWGAVTAGLPGIAIQLVLIPVI
ncbi:MAG: ECF transporter S component, partial [Oscillospiraceae bacterium]|nr:ECF transporter S component [Oscillospiraceae bacterium]